jgi:ubiquinone/menaquinone biosynthesis C-methylase UbiE
MASKRKNHVCPMSLAGSLDSRLRRWLQNPRKILGPYVKEGMTALDVGCGPGFFSVDMACMVGDSGRVIACDLQEGMLQIIRDKIRGTDLEERVTLHKCEEKSVGVTDPVDFVLLFYTAHEVPDEEALFDELAAIVKPGGRILLVEPPFHIPKAVFAKTVGRAQDAGFSEVERPKMFLGHAVLLRKDE